MMINKTLYSLFFVLFSCFSFAQEGLRPLSSNITYIYPDLKSKAVKPNTDISAQRTSSISYSLPFIEDFYYSSTSNYPDPTKWQDSNVYVNSGMPIAPLSIGVATFDGLNKYGYPYNPTLSNLTKSDPADKLTSQPINLYTSGSTTLNPTIDNIALSFYYQARGNGDGPEQSDSLILDFFKPRQNKWQTRVWYQEGNLSSNTLDTNFKRAFIRITDSAYFHPDFQFRFRNYASVTGNFDHWHLDYIFLDKNRPQSDSLTDTTRKDITIAGIPTSFLKNYSAMPLQQYLPSEMAFRTNVRIRNNHSAKENIYYRYRVFDMYGNPVFSEYDGGAENINPFWKNNAVPPGYGYSKVPSQATPIVIDTFEITKSTGVYFPIKHYVFYDNGVPDAVPANDTVIQYQRFYNYYAFDDGSAEAGYYVNAALAKIAVKIKLNKTDSLTGVRIYFDPAGNVSTITNPNSVYNFTLNVWSADGNGNPVNSPPYYRDSSAYRPKYSDSAGFKEVPEYRFKRPLILNPGTYFIGIQQASSILTIGFDKNYNHKESLYFDSGNNFEQSKENGSIMMQPFFGTFYAPVGIEELKRSLKNQFLVYPNPSSDEFNIVTSEFENSGYQLYNSLGQLIKSEKIDSSHHTVSTNELGAGIYILVLKSKGQAVQQQKIIVQH
ncbi:hypothetical protein CNR22_16870 [Sphingobacteriaceae bacterium]|nr:hypothetical protein CNR22_16870 [Sphingobacteriaceae bacterium]